MNRMESKSPETTSRMPSELPATMKMIGLALMTVLTAAGCNGKVNNGFGVISETGKCLKEKMSAALTEKCTTEEGRTELADFASGGNCEKIPAPDTPLSFGGNKGTARDFVEQGVEAVCKKE